ncbi:hypothetical protein Theam_1663 [Thermovibrio ammonificans HB-1]|uniref:Uncharacterized protein n=1 Tax=Thermovibrio ammonificans (strain DSM 15698 / JCM 12110 / HB-1) TaxID=648996 RepID=E8T5G5_THEA1|nr:hypothetical protein [Thermovibrio ammonificans]ADU97619.1 hypothetical protein Theam_1663 [Thermovibrio ammonificans HB-1]
MKKFITFFLLLHLFAPVAFGAPSEDVPVEARIAYKQVNGKVVEVVVIKTKSGKTYELYPGIAPSQIPRPSSSIPREKSEFLYLISGFLVGLLGAGVVAVWWLNRREKEGR